MAFDVQFEDDFWLDLQEAYDYYSSKNLQVAEKLNEEFMESVAVLSGNSFFQLKYNDFRSIKLRSFPYAIYYKFDEINNIVVCRALVQLQQNSDKYPA